MGREGPQQDSRKNNGLPEPEGARNKDKLLADREVHAKERKLSGHRVEHDAEKMKKKPSGHRVARDAKDDKYPGRRVERDVKDKLKDKLKGHRVEHDAKKIKKRYSDERIAEKVQRYSEELYARAN